jgi:hypothetical protein
VRGGEVIVASGPRVETSEPVSGADDGTGRSKQAVVSHVQFGGRSNDEQPNDSDHAADHQAKF